MAMLKVHVSSQAREIMFMLILDIIMQLVISLQTKCSFGERTGLMVRASDSGSGDPGSILGRVGVFVSLSKRHLLPKSTGNTQE